MLFGCSTVVWDLQFERCQRNLSTDINYLCGRIQCGCRRLSEHCRGTRHSKLIPDFRSNAVWILSPRTGPVTSMVCQERVKIHQSLAQAAITLLLWDVHL